MKNLKIIGSGDAFGSGGKYNTSFLVRDENGGFLIDCGASTIIRLKQLNIDLTSIHTVFISHFHGDHYGGLPFLILSFRYEYECENKLNIVGPKGIKEKVYNLQEAMYPDTGYLIDELNLNFTEFDSKNGNDIKGVHCEAIPVHHAPGAFPHGIRLSWNDKTLAYSGDTEWTESIYKVCKGAEFFICECNFVEKEIPGHLSYKILKAKLSDFNPSNLYLTHMNKSMIENSEVIYKKLNDGDEFELW
ncbi:MAG: MBL fold metallo-hydrolase [Bacteroidota bacterium]